MFHVVFSSFPFMIFIFGCDYKKQSKSFVENIMWKRKNNIKKKYLHPQDKTAVNFLVNFLYDDQLLGWEDLLEKEMATHSSLLPGESHRQRSLVGYSPWGCKRVWHNLATKTTVLEVRTQNGFVHFYVTLLMEDA